MPPKQIVFQKLCPHRTLPQQILHVLSPNSSMLCFDMFGLNLHSALLQDFHSVRRLRILVCVEGNRPTLSTPSHGSFPCGKDTPPTDRPHRTFPPLGLECTNRKVHRTSPNSANFSTKSYNLSLFLTAPA